MAKGKQKNVPKRSAPKKKVPAKKLPKRGWSWKAGNWNVSTTTLKQTDPQPVTCCYRRIGVPVSSTALMAPPLIGLKEPLRWCRFRVSDVVAYLGVFHPPWQGVSDGPWRSPRQVWSSGRWSGRGGGALRAPSGPSAPLRASAGHRGRALGGVRWSGSGHRSPHAVEPCSLGPR